MVKCEDRVIQEEIFDRADKKIVPSRQERSYKQHASIRNCSMIPGLLQHWLLTVLTARVKIGNKNIEQLFCSLSLENLKNSSELEHVPQFNKINNGRAQPTRAFPSRGNLEDTLKKSPSTPNLNWRYAVTEETIRANSGITTAGGGGGGGGGGGHSQDIVVKRRPKKAPRPRPRSEFRERSEETWIDGERWERQENKLLTTIVLIFSW